MSDKFGEIFEIELKCWCHGLERVREKVDIGVLHKVIKEFAPVLAESIENLFVCDLVETAKRFCSSAKCKNNEREIVYYLLSHLPVPADLNPDQVKILEQIVQKVENIHPGAFKRLEKKWTAVKQPQEQEQFSFENLSFPPKSSVSA